MPRRRVLCPSKQREALSFRASARREASALGVHTGVGIRLPSPPSEREVSARSADGGRDAPRFSLPQSATPTAPSQRGPNSAALPRCRDVEDAVPYGWITHLPRRAGPMCPAAGYAFFGGTHGSRPTGAYPPLKKTTRRPLNKGAPRFPSMYRTDGGGLYSPLGWSGNREGNLSRFRPFYCRPCCRRSY